MNRRVLVATLLSVMALGTFALAGSDSGKPKGPDAGAQEVARINARLVELVQQGKYAECEPLIKQLLKIDPKDNVAWYNLACVYSRLGKNEDALQALATAVKFGWRDLEYMEKDEDLAPLRKTRGYQVLRELLGRMQSAPPSSGPASQPATRPAAPQPTTIPRPPVEVGTLSREQQRELALLRRQVLRQFEAKEYDKAREVLHKILELLPDSGGDWYNLACAHARLNNIPEAIACLNYAVQKGYTGFRHMERDPDLKALRWAPAYKELLARKDEVQRARAEKILEALRSKYGADYICEVDHDRKMVFATNVDRRTLEELKAYLTQYASAQWRDLFSNPFEEYVTIVVPKDWPNARVGGYYNHAARVLVCKSVGMVLTHEFTHAMHFADLDGLGQSHPIWVVEGLATLFETSNLVNGHAVPEANHRLNVVQQLLKENKAIPLRDLFKLSHIEFMRKAGSAYAQSRYFMMYLFEKGLLKKWYDAYSDSFDQDATGAKALTKVFGKDLSEIEADWRNWVLAKQALMLRLPANHAYLGITVEAVQDGVRVARIVPGSGADRAGLKLGDVIVRIDGQRLVDPPALIRVVGAHKVGDKVKVEFRRDGKYEVTTVSLQAMPAELAAGPATQPATQPASKKPQPATQPAPEKPQPPATRPVKPVQPKPQPPPKPQPAKPEPKPAPKPAQPATRPAPPKAQPPAPPHKAPDKPRPTTQPQPATQPQPDRHEAPKPRT